MIFGHKNFSLLFQEQTKIDENKASLVAVVIFLIVRFYLCSARSPYIVTPTFIAQRNYLASQLCCAHRLRYVSWANAIHTIRDYEKLDEHNSRHGTSGIQFCAQCAASRLASSTVNWLFAFILMCVFCLFSSTKSSVTSMYTIVTSYLWWFRPLSPSCAFPQNRALSRAAP